MNDVNIKTLEKCEFTKGEIGIKKRVRISILFVHCQVELIVIAHIPL